MKREQIQMLPTELESITDVERWEESVGYSAFSASAVERLKAYLRPKPILLAISSEEQVLGNTQLTLREKQRALRNLRSKDLWRSEGPFIRLNPGKRFYNDRKPTEQVELEQGKRIVYAWFPNLSLRTSGKPYTERTLLGLSELPAPCASSPNGICERKWLGPRLPAELRCLFCDVVYGDSENGEYTQKLTLIKRQERAYTQETVRLARELKTK